MATQYVPNNTIVVIGDGVPTDASFVTPPAEGQLYVDQTTLILYVRVLGVWHHAALT